MSLKQFLPFSRNQGNVSVEIIDSVVEKKLSLKEPDDKIIAKLFKIAALGLGFNTGLSSYLQNPRRAAFEECPYDLDRIIQAVDTDSYVKQSFNKYSELFWKEGWEIISENPEAVNYLWQRLDLMELFMKKSFQSFLEEVFDQLIKFHNVFIAISRGNISPYISHSVRGHGGLDPICGFYVIPTEKVEILRDKHNKPVAYKQTVEDVGINTKQTEPIWDASEVIHLHRDRKPGRPYGTPFVVSVLDDVISYRQIEEDILNLVHKELFPLFKYKVGTETKPATQEEVDDAREQLEDFRTQGGLVIPERHDVEVVGSEGNALDASDYVNQFRTRVIAGLGLAPHHLGILDSGANRAVTDRLDIALYDKIKHYQRYFADSVRLFIFNALLIEGGFDPYRVPTDEKTTSDRCNMRFRQIDTDTQVKLESHHANLFANNGITWDEFRLRLGEDPNAPKDELLMNMQHMLTMEQSMEQIKLTAAVTPQQKSQTVTKTATGGVSKKTTEPVKPDAARPSTGIKPNSPNNTKGLGQIIKPSNQHGRQTSPNIRHDEPDDIISEWIDEFVVLCEQGE